MLAALKEARANWPKTRARLRAWWEGEDVDLSLYGDEDEDEAVEAVAAALNDPPAKAEPAKKPAPQPAPKRKEVVQKQPEDLELAEPDAVEPDDTPEPAAPQKDPAVQGHIALAQQVWGEGKLGPGADEFEIDLCSPLALTKSHTIAWLGIGLGGPARAVAQEYGVWINGYERRSNLIEPAQAQCAKSGLAKKVTLAPFVTGETELPERKYHGVICRDELPWFHERGHVIEQAYHALRPGGVFLLTDYVASEKDAATLAKSSFGGPWGWPELWTEARVADALEEAGFELQTPADLSADYAAAIGESAPVWAQLLKQMTAGPGNGLVTVHQIGAEVEMWLRRQSALKLGTLRLVRFTALRSR